ncbi:MAG: deoxyhypusine synthase family protein, partial [Candidatus Heimdallarchaeaceae archaeon]
MKPEKNEYPRVKPVDLKDDYSIENLIEEFQQSGVFGPGRVGKAVDIYAKMIKDKAVIFLGLAGALIPGGMRQILTEMIRKEMAHVIVSTGANITHDIIEAVGGKHLKQIPYMSDKELR